MIEQLKFVLFGAALLMIVSMFPLYTRSQDSWESYEDYSDEYIYKDDDDNNGNNDEEINMTLAKEEFCFTSDIRPKMVQCLTKFEFFGHIVNESLECLPSLGIYKTDVAEILEEICKPETDVNLGPELRQCILERRRVQNLPVVTYKTGKTHEFYLRLTKICDPLRTALMNRKWMPYFDVEL